MMLLVGGFTTAWPPYYHKNNQNGKGQLICSKVLNLYLPVAGIFAVMISLSAPLALRLMTPQSYFEAYTVVPFVAMAYMLKGPYLIFMMGVLMKEKTTWQLSLEAVAAGLYWIKYPLNTINWKGSSGYHYFIFIRSNGLWRISNGPPNQSNTGIVSYKNCRRRSYMLPVGEQCFYSRLFKKPIGGL